MIELTIFNFLKDRINVPVYMEKVEKPPTEWVFLEKISEYNDQRLRRVTVAVQSYSKSLYKTALLNELVISHMEELTTLDSIGKCKLSSSYNYTDTQAKQYRYQAIFDVVY
ncbi:MAG: hypothetical protein Q4E28_04995 [Clostridia bacterium]|nr:hypothetical protein [Clostridia bacterium]